MSTDINTTSFARTNSCADTDAVRIAGIQRAGMLDWPGKVTATVFLAGCNLRCPFCHNPELIGVPRRLDSLDSLLALVRERRDWLDGVVVTGGEPLSSAAAIPFLRLLRREGVAVKLDTNGTYPELLAQAIEERLVDFVALDVKASPEKYERATGVRELWPLVERSIEAIIEGDVEHEFRTTCYPLAVGPDDPVDIAANLVGGSRYVLQQYCPSRTLDPAAVSVRPHSPETLCRAAERCSAFLPTGVRGAAR